jgi:hypothetical protein
MNKDRRHASWLARWTHPRPAALRDDPADYGTCFGLEMSVGAQQGHADAADAPLPMPASHGAPGWWARWRQRAA